MATIIIQEKNVRYSKDMFGINTSLADPVSPNIPTQFNYENRASKFGIRRSHDDRYTTWDRIETSAGVYDWSGLDEWVFRNRGGKLMWTIYQTPTFYATDPASIGAYGAGRPGANTPPLDKTKLYNFVAAGLARYRDFGIKIDYLEPFNEVNMKSFYNGTVADMAECLRQIRLARDAISPSTKILTPSLTNFDVGSVYTADNQNPSTYLPTMLYALDTTGKKLISHCDIFNVHLYGTPALMYDRITLVKNLASTYALTQLPLFNSELNYKHNGESEAYMTIQYVRAMFLPVVMGIPTTLYKFGNAGDTTSGYSMASTPTAFDNLCQVIKDTLTYGIDRVALETTSGQITLRINDVATAY